MSREQLTWSGSEYEEVHAGTSRDALTSSRMQKSEKVLHVYNLRPREADL